MINITNKDYKKREDIKVFSVSKKKKEKKQQYGRERYRNLS